MLLSFLSRTDSVSRIIMKQSVYLALLSRKLQESSALALLRSQVYLELRYYSTYRRDNRLGALINLAVSLMHAGDLRDSTELKIKRAQALFKGKDPSGYLQSTCVLGQYYLFRGDLFKADEVLNSAAIEAGLIPSTERVDVTGYLMRENTEFIEDEMD